MTKDVRVPVSLTTAQHEQLTAAARTLGLTLSAFIRLAALERVSG